ncbi:Vegetative incompatibility HET-E-1 [Fusarium acuminatum]|uniref:Vegetative incompatibility HET-E-1 n=1 Tax=Fusarium acuminatum TaxID=5515 RepID=A0ABZ2X3P0_9HYPO
MASIQSRSFERSLEQFRRELSDTEMKEIGGANQKSLEATIQKIQRQLGREHGLCKLTRVEALVRAMKNIEELVTIFLNVSEVVAFIWGPIKLALMVATTWGDSVRQLIDVYEETAEAFGNLVFFRKLLQSREHLRVVLEDYFSDILRFHRCVLDVFSPPDGKRLFKWAWVTFRRRVKPIVASLRRRHDMLSDGKLQSHAILKEIEDFESSAKDCFKNLQAGLEDIRASVTSDELRSKALQDQEMRANLERKLDVPKPRSDLQLESPERILESSGNWISSHPAYYFWETNTPPEGSVLFLNGSPGSAADSVELSTLKTLSKDCITSQRSAILVIDGLDEASDNEPEKSLKWCLDDLLATAASRGCHLKILISGQRDGRLEPLLSSHPQIRLDGADAHMDDIKEYCKSQAAKIRARFSLTSQEEESLIAKVAGVSKGMFLYARVVLENLASMDSIQEYEDELEAEKFPEDLYLAYLIYTGTINLLQEHASMALFCCRYLSSQPFLVAEECSDIYSAIQTGYFGFMDYAVVHFNSHCQAIQSSDEKLPPASESKIAVDAAMRELVRSHSGEAQDALIESPCTVHPLETSNQTLGLSIQQSVAVVRETMHARQNDLSLDAQFTSLEGPIRFKCPRIQCSKFAIGFVEQNAHEKHLEAHERPFRCSHPDCFAYVTGYASQQQLRNHSDGVHSESSRPEFSFPTVNGKGEWGIVEACKAGNLNEVRRFHQAGVDLSVHKRTSLLFLATRAGHFQICEYLVNNGVDPWADHFWGKVKRLPIRVAIAQKRVQVMELFLRRNYDATHLPSLIALAISADFPRGLDLVDLFIRNSQVQTAFSYAVVSLDSVVAGVLECLVQTDKKLAWTADEDGAHLTPLHYAMKSLQLPITNFGTRSRRVAAATFLLCLRLKIFRKLIWLAHLPTIPKRYDSLRKITVWMRPWKSWIDMDFSH